ncbi:MAG: TIGR00282 family metallophosphoesterase [Firmicutes bacterium]|nr:TIGR00282 family metallophosphoesterase [Bacillota bacterium]
MNKEFVILCIGDVVGQEAARLLCARLEGLKSEYGADMAIVNAENAAEGNGLDRATAEEIEASGADVITTGNHVWQKRDLRQFLDGNSDILRPANYRAELAGRGWGIYEIHGVRVLVFNMAGTVYMNPLACPFETSDRILETACGKYDVSVLDFHAEATSEKIALANYLDGRVSVVFGTHTHVQTADERILPKGTGYITDLGMTGPLDSVLGVETARIIEYLKNHIPVRFETAKGNIRLNGAVFRIDTGTGKTLSVKRICIEI